MHLIVAKWPQPMQWSCFSRITEFKWFSLINKIENYLLKYISERIFWPWIKTFIQLSFVVEISEARLKLWIFPGAPVFFLCAHKSNSLFSISFFFSFVCIFFLSHRVLNQNKTKIFYQFCLWHPTTNLAVQLIFGI